MRPKTKGTYYLDLIDILEGDYIRAGEKFPGPMYMSKVIAIEWVSDVQIRILTERGEYFGPPYGKAAVNLREFNPTDKSGK